ncbi:hypothetical protein HPB52_003434 [Rhipicephalus sanguineus]|uniref:Uncharacterized protein n=1 Tax=Rhipicephalus sanguineus TaxID=34632 RepID=A0A9D4T6R7_RHISA|nr:hypothetical protein HPB52_003434 [Rhipicephalus sanguineus]
MASASPAAMDDDEAERKKLRLEENLLDDKTSTYNLSDEEDVGEDEPFTLVAYKKKRAEGIPVVFRPTAEGASFWKATRKVKLLRKCVGMSSFMEENRALMNPLQTLRLFILYVIYLSAHRNNSSRQTPREPPRAHPRDHSREVHLSTPTYASKLRTPTRPQPESSRTDSASVRPSYNIETSRRSQQASETEPFKGDHASASVMQLILPMLFAALQAILSALPEANNLPEVKALLPLEALLYQQSGSDLRQVTYG